MPLLATINPNLPQDLDPILQQVTAKEPAGRFPDILSFRKAIISTFSGGHLTLDEQQPSKDIVQPPFLEENVEPDRPVFVGRENEIGWLKEKAELAYQGQLSTIFVFGDPGAGKSSLLSAFAKALSDDRPDLLVAWGSCNAFSGSGDPYLPFRDIFSTLAGDIETRWAAGTLTGRQARELWEAFPLVTESILDMGPDLVGTFVPASMLAKNATTSIPPDSPLLIRLRQKTAKEDAASGELEQPQLFEQVSAVLTNLSEHRPILLLLDDFQWADSGSINLLFHLGRRLTAGKILIVCAYRGEELMLGRGQDGNNKRHPLLPILDEFKRSFGEIWLDLGLAQDMAFVDDFVDSEPNNLDMSFRKSLFDRTRGHPLFTVELLRELRERGDLIRDEDGLWVAGPELHWDSLPARVEGVIEARIGRLEEELREILTVAAVEGEDFTAQVVARVQQLQERRLLRTLSQELDRRHQLVRERSTLQIDQRYLARYRFAHALFQQYLYNDISDVERRLLHGEIAAVLEELYAGRTNELAVQLARHWIEAGEGEKALDYLLEAGNKSRNLYAFEDAAEHYEQALAILRKQGDLEQLASTLMKLGHTYHGFFEFDRAQQAYEEAFYIKSQFDDSLTGVQLPEAPHAYRTTYQTIPMTLDPTRSIEGEFVLDLFSGLVQITPTLEVIPDVAKSWKIMDGGRTYIFHLRDDVYWSDGILVTAGDFIFAWRRALDPVQGSPVANLLYDIKGAESFHHGQLENEEMLGISALNESTIRIELEEPTSYFLQLLAIFVSKPVPRHTVELYSETWAEPGNIVTNGPFFLASWQEDNSLVLERNPTYHGHFQGNLNRVELRYIHDSKGMLDLYEADELDALSIWHLAPAELGRALSYKAGEIMTLPSHTTGFLGFNTLRPPLDDPRVRRALILAKDRFSSDDTGDAERSDPPTGGFVPPTIPGHVPDIALPYDPSLARALLAEAGYPDGRGFPVLEAIVATWDQDRLPKQFKIWKSKLGVEISWKVIEWDHYMDRIQSDDGPHIYGFGWGALYPDPDSYLRVGIRQISNWRHEGYEQLVELARHKMEFSERMDLYQQAERILVDESPIMPYKYLRLNLLVKPWVKSYHPEYLWEYWKDVILEPH